MKVAIVGGGLVGALNAIFFAKRGEEVEIYELREAPTLRGRSINLALSERGLAALAAVGLKDKVQSMVTPMTGRMLHNLDGSLTRVPYGSFGQAINSIDRRKLNELLLDEASTYPNVKLYFKYDLEHANFDLGELNLIDKAENKAVKVYADLIIGADGAYSSTRKELMRKIRFNYCQEYIEHGYMELNVPPTADDEFAMAHDALHIWPRRSFMMIALPNTDKTFTLTLFMPFNIFESLKTEKQLFTFFEQEFPDALDLVGRKELSNLFFKNPVGPLMSIKVVSSYDGQGMNCGFEDCLVLDRILYEEGHKTRALALEAYSVTRHPDLVSICDLALNNYEEMRSSVLNVSYHIRKYVEGSLHVLFPNTIIPLYTMVSFSTIPYAQVIKRWNRQTYLLYGLAGGILGLLFLGARRMVASLSSGPLSIKSVKAANAPMVDASLLSIGSDVVHSTLSLSGMVARNTWKSISSIFGTTTQ